MLYYGEFADDLLLLLRDGGAKLLVQLYGGLSAEEADKFIWRVKE